MRFVYKHCLRFVVTYSCYSFVTFDVYDNDHLTDVVLEYDRWLKMWKISGSNVRGYNVSNVNSSCLSAIIRHVIELDRAYEQLRWNTEKHSDEQRIYYRNKHKRAKKEVI